MDTHVNPLDPLGYLAAAAAEDAPMAAAPATSQLHPGICSMAFDAMVAASFIAEEAGASQLVEGGARRQRNPRHV